MRKTIERVFLDLEQFVARIVLQHVRQRFAGVTVGVEAGVPLDMRDLAPQIGNAVRRARVGGRREQSDDAMLADQIAVGIEAFDADIIEIDAAVHARLNIGLGDDQRARLLQERHDLRGDFEQLVAMPEHAQLARAHDAERILDGPA